MKYDIVVIGSGPAGFKIAAKMRKSGKAVCMIEKSKLGGVCLNYGCIPTKTLAAAAKKYKELGSLKRFGITLEHAKFDYPTFKKFQNLVVNRLKNALKHALEHYQIDYLEGSAEIINGKVKVNDKLVDYEKLIIAIGSSSFVPEKWKDMPNVIDPEKFWEFDDIPQNIAIIGGGVIGCEYASSLADLGYKVSLFEKLDTLIASEEVEIQKAIFKELKAKGVKISLGKEIEVDDIDADLIICAIGRISNSFEGFFDSSKDLKISENVFVIGDAAKGDKLAHKAYFDADALYDMLEHGKGFAGYSNKIPSVIFTNPEISRSGITKQEAPYAKQIRVDFAHIGKAVAENSSKGFVLVNYDASNFKVLGISVFGSHASEMNAAAQLIIENNMTLEHVKNTTFSHPTVSEIFKIAALKGLVN